MKGQKKLWELCKQITRARYITPQGFWNCYTCDVLITLQCLAHTGHCFRSGSSGILLRYELDNLRVQCETCNIEKDGNFEEFKRRLRIEIGVERVAEMERMSWRPHRIFNHEMWYSEKIEEYSRILATSAIHT